MEKKAISGISLILLLTSMLTSTLNIQPVKAAPTTIIVPDDYPTIQEAINNANEGDTIFVRNGTYMENIVVKKNKLRLVGESKASTIIDGAQKGTVVRIQADYIAFEGFTIKNCGNAYQASGIHLDYSIGSNVSGNEISSCNRYGVFVDHSLDCLLSSNNIIDSGFHGIGGVSLLLSYSSDISLNNNIINYKVPYLGFGVTGVSVEHYIHSIDISNKLNGKPILYLLNQNDLTVNPSTFPNIGYIALVNSSSISVEDLNLNNYPSWIANMQGVLFAFVTNSTIRRITSEYNTYGVYLSGCCNVSVYGNAMPYASETGIYVSDSRNCSVYGNTMASNSLAGIRADRISGCSFCNNTANKNQYGLYISESSECFVSNNVITDNTYGISIKWSSRCFIRNNSAAGNNGFGIQTGFYSYSCVISKNRVVNSTGHGIRLSWQASNCEVYENTISNTMYGISVSDSSGYLLRDNNLTTNQFGAYLERSSSGRIFHNNFVNNTNQVYALESVSYWDNGYPSGGNYWSDYAETDLRKGPYQNVSGSDGIGDIPYVIDGNNEDNYPLMYPWGSLPVHNLATGLCYEAIQEAIEAGETADGHTILVEAGIYCEHVDVSKSISLIGEAKETTIVDGNGTGSVIWISAYNVTISGFTVRKSGRLEFWGAGIVVYHSGNNNIRHNIIENNEKGIYLSAVTSSYNVISENIVKNNYYGIMTGAASNNFFYGNYITNNSWGVFLYPGYNNTFYDNDITDNSVCISLHMSSNNTISRNKIANNWPSGDGTGVGLVESSNNTISGNNITDNNSGIYIEQGSSGNIVSRNSLEDNRVGIVLNYAYNNSISENFIASNLYSMNFHESSNNVIYHNNFMNNTEGMYLPTIGPNIWDDGYPSGGNYWSDYSDIDLYHGPNQNFTGSDGIWDHPYVITPTNQDDYPLVNAWTLGAIHDVAVTDVVVSGTRVQEGTILEVNVTVHNDGTVTETLTVQAFYNNNTIQAPNIITLDASAETTLTFVWNTSGAVGNCAIYARASMVAGETNVSNNVFFNGVVEVIASVAVPIPGGETATIEGNVTITQAVVRKNTLHFDASGPSGSTGWINVTFPMVNTTDIKVFINKVRLRPPPFPIITANATYYFIYFEFTLSTHEIIISFGPLEVIMFSPQNKTYYSNNIPLSFETGEPASWIGYSLDNQPNVTITGNTIIDVTDGSHQIVLYANDTSGNMNSSEIICFTVDSSSYAPWKTSFVGLGGYPVVDFAVYNGNLYAASDNTLYMFNGSSWNIIDAPTFVLSLVPYEDKLIIGGKNGLYSYDGTTFTLVFTVSNYIKPLGVYDNTLFAGTILDKPPTLYYCNGSPENPNNWHIDTTFSTILNFSGPFGSIDSFAVYNANLYITSGGSVYSYNGTDWSIAKTYDDVYAFLDMKVHNGKVYLATRDSSIRRPLYQGGSGFCGRVIEFDGNNWTTVFDHDYWLYSLETYNGKLYVGTANKIFAYNGTDWKLSFKATEGAYYAVSLITFDGKIYTGMGNGHIFVDPSPEIMQSETVIIPEFPSFIILPLLMLAALVAVMINKKKRVP